MTGGYVWMDSERTWNEEVLFDVESRPTESNRRNLSEERFTRLEMDMLTFCILLWSIIGLDNI
jgi:hypothetical protein